MRYDYLDKNWRSRVISLILSLAVIFGMTPFNLAVNATEQETAPLDISVSDVGEDTAALKVTNNLTNAGTTLALYLVQERTADAPEQVSPSNYSGMLNVTGSGKSGETALTGLKPGTEYVVYVNLLYYLEGESGTEDPHFSELISVEFTTADEQAASMDVSVTDVGEDTAALKVTNNLTNAGTTLALYLVQERTADAPEQVSTSNYSGMLNVTGSGKSGETALTGLKPGTEYVVYVNLLYYLEGESGSDAPHFSELISVEFTTADEQTASMDVSVTDVGEDTAALKVTNNLTNAGTTLALYLVQESTADAPEQVSTSNYSGMLNVTGSGKSGETALTGLKPGTEYVVYVNLLYYLEGESGSDAPHFSELISVEFTTADESPGGEDSPEDSAMSLSYCDENGERVTKYYIDYSEAVSTLNGLTEELTDAELTLLDDINIKIGEEQTEAINLFRSCTLDLAGHTLAISSDYDPAGICVNDGVSFTLKDSSENEGKILLTSASGTAIALGKTKRDECYFVMESGSIISKLKNGTDIYAVTIRGDSRAVIQDGYINGIVLDAGELTVNGGTIEADSLTSVVDVYAGGRLSMTGGTVRNICTSSATGTNVCAVAAKSTYEATDGDDQVKITGGTLSTIDGSALNLSNTDTLSLTIQIRNAELISENGAALCFTSRTCGSYTYDINIGSGAILNGKAGGIEITDKGKYIEKYDFLKINIEEGAYFKYADGNIPITPNSSYVTYPEGMVLGVNPIASDTVDGVIYNTYTLANIKDLKQMVGDIECEYQYLDELKNAISGAAEIYNAGNDTGSYDSELWDDFVSAYESALPILENANANQNEIDHFTETLGSAQAEMIAEAEKNVNLSDLADGTYKVNVEMWDTMFSRLSMANGAVSSEAEIEIKGGKASITLDFSPIKQLGYWGSMMQFWTYAGTTPAEAKQNCLSYGGNLDYLNEAKYLTYQLVDFNTGTTTPIEGTPEEEPSLTNEIRPASIQLPLSYMGNNNDYNKIYCYIGVDMMRGGVGDQSCVLYIKYSTLEAVDVVDTLTVDTTEMRLMTGGVQTTEAKVLGGSGYTLKVESDDEDVATAKIDENGFITVNGVGAGTANITVEAVNGDNILKKTVSVMVYSTDSVAVTVESVSISGSAATVVMTGDVLITGSSSSENGSITYADSAVTVDIGSSDSDITSAEIIIPASVSSALNGIATTFVTDIGSVKIDSDLMSQIEAVGNEAVLTINEKDVASIAVTGEFSAAYEISLTSGNSDIDFGTSGTATVIVPTTLSKGYAYCIDNGGKKTERIDLVVSDGYASWNTRHFSLWALSADEYTISSSTPGGNNSSGGNGNGSSSSYFLEDGNYYVDIDLYKASSNSEVSMGNVAFDNNDKALVTVKNGKITTVQIGTNPVNVSGYHSAIITFEVDGSTVEVLETEKVTTSSPTQSSIATYDYVKLVQFEMPANVQPSYSDQVTYVPVTFYVPDTPMDEVVDAANGLNAQIRFDWSTATKTSKTSLTVSTQSGSGTSSITGSDIESVTLTDSATGVKLTTDTERLSDKAVMTVSKLTSGTEYDTAVKAMDGVSGEWSLYKIDTAVDGKSVAPEGSVSLYFPCGGEELTIYRISDSGTKTILKGSVKNGYYVVSTSSLGMFAVMGDISGDIPADVPEGEFADVQNHWAKEYIKAVADRGLFNGVSDTEFSPNTSMTRAMFVTVLGRLAGADVSSAGTTAFTDVKDGSWYASYVSWAVDNGIVKGVSETSFAPDQAITRQEMAVFLSRYAEFAKIALKDGDEVNFADSSDISAYAADAVNQMTKAGLLNGVGDNRFAPKNTATRAEVATLLSRFINDYSL